MICVLKAKNGGEAGVAMVMVMGVSAVLLLLVGVAVTAALGNMKQARTTQDWGGALGAAYAGVEEYQSRLANDSSYQRYGNPASNFTPDSTPLPAETNSALGLGPTGTWATVAGSDGTATFRYEVDNSEYAITGKLSLRSTGRVGDETRTIVAELKQQGFIDFLYFTDYEIQDPVLSGKDVSTCVKYVWQGRPNGCVDIQFGGNDVIRGPAHSNDAMRVCEARFEGPVTTAYNPASGPRYINPGCTGQVFSVAGSPAYSPVVGMPPTNSELKRETRSDLTTSGVPLPGCLYTGPTNIVLNSNGTMTVRSPWTKATRVQGDPATSGTQPAACGTPTQLQSAGGATITVPPNNVVYVQNVPNVSTDPNYTSTNTLKCRNGVNNIGYPISREEAPSGAYGCRNGDVFVKGTLDGRVTIAAENYIYVTDDIVYKDAQDDILGLVGNNAVWVWNPVDGNDDSLLNDDNLRIDAAILSVAHTFAVQNYDNGEARGTLTVNGAIAQKFRGIVAQTSNGTVISGYIKNYVYDPRLRYTAPPKFLSPVTTTYGVNIWVEVEPAFSSTGEYR